jgi:hypothetical protein
MLKAQDMEAFIEQVSDIINKVFQAYCSFGDPLNLDKLKSNKFIKIFSDLDLISQHDGFSSVESSPLGKSSSLK